MEQPAEETRGGESPGDWKVAVPLQHGEVIIPAALIRPESQGCDES